MHSAPSGCPSLCKRPVMCSAGAPTVNATCEARENLEYLEVGSVDICQPCFWSINVKNGLGPKFDDWCILMWLARRKKNALEAGESKTRIELPNQGVTNVVTSFKLGVQESERLQYILNMMAPQQLNDICLVQTKPFQSLKQHETKCLTWF